MSQARRDEESAYELSGLLEQRERDLADGVDAQESRNRTSYLEQSVTAPRNNNTDYLDGVRGLAALFVFVQHGIGGFGLGATEFGFGQDGYYALACFPFIRLLFSGGNCAVSIFFILSGYVLSVAPLRKLKANQDIGRRLVSAVIRRPIRLYLAPLVTSFIFAMLLHVPGPLVLPTPVIHPQESFYAEFAYYLDRTWDFFRLNRPHGSHLFSYPYNIVMWTLPIELKGSFLVYGLLFILSLGIQGTDTKGPFMIALLLFCTSSAMLYRAFYWSMAAFLSGVMLALVDTWPGIETRISTAFDQRPFWLRLPVGTPLGIRRRFTALVARITPDRVLQRLSHTFRSQGTESTFAYVCFWVGGYFLSQPSHAGDIGYSSKTPGWVWLSKFIPEEYKDTPYYRYWQTYGALLMIYAILRIGWLQRFFSSRPLRFLGKVSFMLYLVHPLWFRIFGDRVVGLTGQSVDPHLFDSFWDKGLAWLLPNIGPEGIGLRFWFWMALALPSTLGIAWVCMKLFDEPSVRLGHWVVKRLGVEKRELSKASNEGSTLPP